ncbi:MAG: metallopeptidase [Lachnospiraceae bacterium]|nr:metallopeptidase [Lachnospiraceae bacterium]
MNIVQKQKQRELEKIEICMDIWKQSRNELYLSMRFLDVALSRFFFLPETNITGMGTDGFGIYFYPDALIYLYKKDRIYINRAYLHMMFHCLFGHLTIPEAVDETLWNLAADIAAESILDGISVRSLRRYVSPYRKKVYQSLREKISVLTVAGIYKVLEEKEAEGDSWIGAADLEKLQGEFFVDDHRLWNQEIPQQKMMERQKEWKEENEKLQTKMETFAKEASEDAEALAEQVRVENRTRYDYKKFLRKFSVLKEEIQVDPDTFDYIFYHYGMEMFGNVPLIEPQETKEVHKVEDFVIAVDTSMSCKEELIRKFLEQTYSVLSESESFFRKICVHIIQCDDKVQSDVVIHNQEEMERYMEHFEIHGFGGTDFRPVFGYVNELIAKKAFQRLRGLIYFTDGYGTFPAKKPLYETAFVFLKEDYSDVDVPVWAMKLILEPEQLRRTEGEKDYGY